MQHTWKVNGALPSSPNSLVDGEHCFGFAGKVNFGIADRLEAGTGGSTILDIRKNGVSIFSVLPTFTAAEGDNVCRKGVLTGVITFTAFDKWTGIVVASEVGPSKTATMTVDVTRTGP